MLQNKKQINEIVLKLNRNSLLDYSYFHLFKNINLNLNFKSNGYKINHIVFVYLSSLLHFFHFYKTNYKDSITDIFIKDIDIKEKESSLLFSLVFNNLFWLRLEDVDLSILDTNIFVRFLKRNSIDLNRLFLERVSLYDSALDSISKISFGNLTFLNLDGNNLSDNQVLINFLGNLNNLEYLSISNNTYDLSVVLNNILNIDSIRILDVSYNNFSSLEDEFEGFIKKINAKELYLYGYIPSINNIESLEEIINSDEHSFNTLGFSYKNKDCHKLKRLQRVCDNKKLNLIVDFVSSDYYYSTVYIKNDNSGKFVSKDNFLFIDENKSNINDFITLNSSLLSRSVNIFLFDIHDYNFISSLIKKYNFNYIYLENYSISYQDFIFFMDLIRSQKNKKYKINLISIEISEEQLIYLINNFPENIFYIEVNLNSISNPDKYIKKMLKNKAFIFENMEIYQKVFNEK